MVPAFFVLVAMHGLGLPFPAAALAGIAVAAILLGLLFRRAVVAPMAAARAPAAGGLDDRALDLHAGGP